MINCRDAHDRQRHRYPEDEFTAQEIEEGKRVYGNYLSLDDIKYRLERNVRDCKIIYPIEDRVKEFCNDVILEETEA